MMSVKKRVKFSVEFESDAGCMMAYKTGAYPLLEDMSMMCIPQGEAPIANDANEREREAKPEATLYISPKNKIARASVPSCYVTGNKLQVGNNKPVLSEAKGSPENLDRSLGKTSEKTKMSSSKAIGHRTRKAQSYGSIKHKESFITSASFFNMKKVTGNPFWRNKIRQAFKVIDLDQDGYIKRSDFEKCAHQYEQRMGTLAPPECTTKCKNLLKMECRGLGLTSGSIVLSLDDYMAKWIERVETGSYSVRHFEDLFKIIDIDAEGRILYHQLYLFYRAMRYDENMHDIDAIKNTFRAMDRDEDKMVFMADFVAYHMEYFFTTKDTLNSSILYGPLPEYY